MIPYYLLTLVATALTGAGAAFDRQAQRVKQRRAAISEAATRRRGGVAVLEAPAVTRTGRVTRWNPADLLAVAALVVFAGTRDGVGHDFGLYTRLYAGLDPFDWRNELGASPQEFGFTGLSLWLKQHTESPHALFFIASTVAVVPIYAAIKKLSLNPALSVALWILLGFYVSPFVVMRQGMAVALNFWAVTFMGRGKRGWLAYAALNGLAFTFHGSVAIAVVVELLAFRWRPTYRSVVTAVAVGIFAAYVVLRVGFVNSVLTSINPRYETYLSGQVIGSQVQQTHIGLYLQIAFRVGLLCLVVRLIRSAGTPLTGQMSRYFSLALMGLIALVIGTRSVTLARLDDYFSLALIILVPNVLAGRQRTGVLTAGVVAASAVYFAFYVTHYGSLVPYRSWGF